MQVAHGLDSRRMAIPSLGQGRGRPARVCPWGREDSASEPHPFPLVPASLRPRGPVAARGWMLGLQDKPWWGQGFLPGAQDLRRPWPWASLQHEDQYQGTCLRDSPHLLSVSGLPAPPGPATAESSDKKKWVSGPALPQPAPRSWIPTESCRRGRSPRGSQEGVLALWVRVESLFLEVIKGSFLTGPTPQKPSDALTSLSTEQDSGSSEESPQPGA